MRRYRPGDPGGLPNYGGMGGRLGMAIAVGILIGIYKLGEAAWHWISSLFSP